MPTKLGQNFLNNSKIVKKIVEFADLSPDDVVFEVGPGKGILTEALSEKVEKVISVEVDEKLISLLRNKFKENSRVEIIESDILKVNIPKLLKDRQIEKYQVIANIPYYITSKIIRLFLESEFLPEKMILMTQKEVAERIVARQGKMSKLSVAVQYYAEPEILFTVDKNNFDPAPKVDSAVVAINNIKKEPNTDTKKFFKIVRAGFCARRKTLVNNLANSLHLPKDDIIEKLETLNLSTSIRAQELSIKDWKNLARLCFNDTRDI